MDIKNFIAEFKKTFVYDLLSVTLKDDQLFEHFVDGDNVIWLKEQTRQMWSMWQQAQKVAVPDGFVVLPIKPTEVMLNAYEKHSIAPIGALSKHGYKAMIEAQDG